MPILQAIRALFRFPAEPLDDLAEERAQYKGKIKAIRRIQARNRLARANALLTKLESHGKPTFDRQEQQQPEPAPHQVSRPVTVAEPTYTADPVTGYPFVPTLTTWNHKPRFEQDPLFGWASDGFYLDFGEAGANVPLSAFPREMYPERPSTLRTQIAQDAIRFMSRAWYETMPQYSGCIGHLCDYTVGSGLTFDVVSDVDEVLAAEVNDYLTTFATYKWNNLDQRVCDSALNLFRDGEDALRLFPGAEYPQLRSTDTSTIRGPHNEITGPWAYGVLTSWPLDYEDVRAYHLWYSDNTHEDVAPGLFKVCKLDTTGSNVKRGVPLAYKIRKQLPQIARLVDCMAVGEAARQAIPYVQQYSMADKSAVGAALRSSEQPDLYGDGRGAWDEGGSDIVPGGVRHISKGQEFVNPPNAQGFAASGTGVYRTLCESCACATRTPIWFWTGSADSENYASSLVSESPVVVYIQGVQRKMTTHYRGILESAVLLGVIQGRFPADVLKICQIHVKLPTPVARNRKEEVETDLLLMGKRLMAPQTVCSNNDLDFQEQSDLTKQAEVDGWTDTPEIQAEAAAQRAIAGGQPQPQIGSDKPAETGNEARAEQEQDKGRWVTTESGTHIFIEGGNITKGPAALVGKTQEEAHGHEREHGKAKDNLSDQDKSEDEYQENFAKVSADPPKADSFSLFRAMNFAGEKAMLYGYHVQQAKEEGRHADADKASSHADAMRGEADWYKQILKERGWMSATHSTPQKGDSDPKPSNVSAHAHNKAMRVTDTGDDFTFDPSSKPIATDLPIARKGDAQAGGDRTKHKQQNLFHGLGDNPNQGQLFGDISKGLFEQWRTAFADGYTAAMRFEGKAAEGRWVTIGSDEEGGGGVHVCIGKGGEILKGPKSLVGKNVKHLSDHVDAPGQKSWNKSWQRKDKLAATAAGKKNAIAETRAQLRTKVEIPEALREFADPNDAGESDEEREHYAQVVESVAKDMHKQRLGEFLHREAAKGHARELTNLNAGRIAQIENGMSHGDRNRLGKGDTRQVKGGDYSAVPGFDVAAEQIAQQYPGVIGHSDAEAGASHESTNLSEALWNLIREGKGKMPMWHDKENIEAAMQYAEHSRDYAGATEGGPSYPDDETPF